MKKSTAATVAPIKLGKSPKSPKSTKHNEEIVLDGIVAEFLSTANYTMHVPSEALKCAGLTETDLVAKSRKCVAQIGTVYVSRHPNETIGENKSFWEKIGRADLAVSREGIAVYASTSCQGEWKDVKGGYLFPLSLTFGQLIKAVTELKKKDSTIIHLDIAVIREPEEKEPEKGAKKEPKKETK